MEYRAGKCSQCGAEYQIPASFAHNVARCKKCKSGVVHLSAPARGVAAPAAPAAEPPRRAHAPALEAAPQRTTSSPLAAEVAPQRPVPAPRPPAVTPALTTAAATGTDAQVARFERAPVEEARRSRTPLLVGLGLVALAAVLFLFRAQIFGSESAGEVTTPAAGPGAAADADHGSAPAKDG